MNITYNNIVLSIKTIESTAKERADIVVSEAGSKTKYRTLISINGEFERTIAIYWSHFSPDADVSIHLAESTNILFVGAGSVSSVINLETKEVIEIHYPDLFWGWECVNNHILELGELECRLYSSVGKLIGFAYVDPPYEYTITESEIQFSSIVMGETKIVYG